MSQFLEDFHASLGDAFTGLPIQPKQLALDRPSQLQSQLDGLDAEDPNNAELIAKLNREIAEANIVVEDENYSVLENDVNYFFFYQSKLKEFIDERA
jgi:hypothetical protein